MNKSTNNPLAHDDNQRNDSDPSCTSRIDPASSVSAAADFWAKDLDPQNLGRSSPLPIQINEEIEFAITPDFTCAVDWFAELPADAPSLVMDLGAGLGANSFALTRRFAKVISVDTSIGRLRELKNRAESVGCATSIFPIVAAAENLPFATGAIPALYTKSVLIHVDLKKTGAELNRILSPQGRAALIEPQPGNPFAWLYRRLLAPKEWQSITTYFTDKVRKKLLSPLISAGHSVDLKPYYLFSFLAFFFQFGKQNLKWFRCLLRPMHFLDHLVFSVLKFLYPLAWFGVIRIKKN